MVVLLASHKADFFSKIHGLKIHGGSAGYPCACVRACVGIPVDACVYMCLYACVCITTYSGGKAIRPTKTA